MGTDFLSEHPVKPIPSLPPFHVPNTKSCPSGASLKDGPGLSQTIIVIWLCVYERLHLAGQL